VAQSLVR